MDSIRILGNFIACNEVFCSKAVAEHNILTLVKHLLAVGTKDHKKETLWIVSNVAANSERDAIAVITHGLIPSLIFSAKDNNIAVKREAIWAISNLCANIHEKDYL